MAEETTQTEVQDTQAVEAAPAKPQTPRFSGDLGSDLSPVTSDEPLKEVANGRPYEITYIVIANDQAALDETQARVKSLIEGVDGAVDNVRVSEVRRLAYPIEKRFEGVYIVINARFEKSLTEELDRYFRIEERVLRHIILRDEQ